MSDDKFHAVTDEFIRDGHALFGVGHIVAGLDNDLLPEYPAVTIEVFGSLIDAVGQLRAERCAGARNRPCNAN